MARVKALKNARSFVAKRFMILRVMGLVNKTLSDASTPLPCCRFLKYSLSNFRGVVLSRKANELELKFIGQDLFSMFSNFESMPRSVVG